MKTATLPKTPRNSPANTQFADQRRSQRLTCDGTIRCRLLGGGLDCWAIRVENLSAGGISLLLDRVVPTGKRLTVEIHHPASRLLCRRQICVIYALQHHMGGLLMGGQFAQPLTSRELETLT